MCCYHKDPPFSTATQQTSPPSRTHPTKNHSTHTSSSRHNTHLHSRGFSRGVVMPNLGRLSELPRKRRAQLGRGWLGNSSQHCTNKSPSAGHPASRARRDSSEHAEVLFGLCSRWSAFGWGCERVGWQDEARGGAGTTTKNQKIKNNFLNYGNTSYRRTGGCSDKYVVLRHRGGLCHDHYYYFYYHKKRFSQP